MYLNGITAAQMERAQLGALGKSRFKKLASRVSSIAKKPLKLVMKITPKPLQKIVQATIVRPTEKLIDIHEKVAVATLINPLEKTQQLSKKLVHSPRFRKILRAVVIAVVVYFSFGTALAWVAANPTLVTGIASLVLKMRNQKQGVNDPEADAAAAQGERDIRDQLRAAGYSDAQADQAIANLRAGMQPDKALESIGPPANRPAPAVVSAPAPSAPTFTPEGEPIYSTPVYRPMPAAVPKMFASESSGGGGGSSRSDEAPAAPGAPAPAKAGGLPSWAIPATLTAIGIAAHALF